jgi:threonine/homoserine/homoserine lactone efflux protein
MTAAAFLSIVLIHLAAAISPGPSFVVAVRTAASDGFKVATALALGFGLGAILWAGNGWPRPSL